MTDEMMTEGHDREDYDAMSGEGYEGNDAIPDLYLAHDLLHGMNYKNMPDRDRIAYAQAVATLATAKLLEDIRGNGIAIKTFDDEPVSIKAYGYALSVAPLAN